MRQHNHHNESKGHKHNNSNHDSKARKLASEAADEEVKIKYYNTLNYIHLHVKYLVAK